MQFTVIPISNILNNIEYVENKYCVSYKYNKQTCSFDFFKYRYYYIIFDSIILPKRRYAMLLHYAKDANIIAFHSEKYLHTDIIIQNKNFIKHLSENFYLTTLYDLFMIKMLM